MIEGGKLVAELERMLRDCTFVFVDYGGSSGGQISCWIKRSFSCSNSWSFSSVLGMALFSRNLGKNTLFPNSYEPYSDRVVY
jgi:hypothetical protein